MIIITNLSEQCKCHRKDVFTSILENYNTPELCFSSRAQRGFLALIILITSNDWIRSATTVKIRCPEVKEEGRTLSIAYVRAVYMRAILLLYTACEQLTTCLLSGTFYICVEGFGGLSLLEKSRGGWLLAGDCLENGRAKSYQTSFSLERTCPVCRWA